jgi:hypothetical protein
MRNDNWFVILSIITVFLNVKDVNAIFIDESSEYHFYDNFHYLTIHV